jgi:hypothetical protein
VKRITNFLGSAECWETLEWLNDWWLLKKDSAVWSQSSKIVKQNGRTSGLRKEECGESKRDEKTKQEEERNRKLKEKRIKKTAEVEPRTSRQRKNRILCICGLINNAFSR